MKKKWECKGDTVSCVLIGAHTGPAMGMFYYGQQMSSRQRSFSQTNVVSLALQATRHLRLGLQV